MRRGGRRAETGGLASLRCQLSPCCLCSSTDATFLPASPLCCLQFLDAVEYWQPKTVSLEEVPQVPLLLHR